MKHSVYLKVAALLLTITVFGAAITALWHPPQEKHSGFCIVTSFYPVYIAAQNVADGADGVEVINMVDNQVGCLHDYQMAPSDRVIAQRADVFVMNGAGAEPFLTEILDTLDSPVIDLSVGQSLLESGHVHSHSHDEHDHSPEDAVNDHLWVSPLRYAQQVQTLCDGLAAADPKNAEVYRRNAAAYIDSILAVFDRLQAAAAPFVDTPSLLFHDSLAYLAEDLGLTVVGALNVGEDSGVSAAQLARTEDALSDVPHAIFWYDSQYLTASYTYLQEIPDKATVLHVDTCVTGDTHKTAWLRAMTALCEQLEATA